MNMPNEYHSLLEALESIITPDEVTLEGDAAVESELFLAALESECTPEEYAALMDECAVEMALYGLIDDAESAMEASRTIVKFSKKDTFDKVAARACIRLAEKANDPEYKKYQKYRALWKESRDKIYKKYMTKARSETKRVLSNSKRKATSMVSDGANSVVSKMDKAIAEKTGNSKK